VLIAVTSDTHFTKDFGQLNRLTCRFSEADLVIHAGDYSEYWVLDYFRTHFKFAGVWGNVDDNKIKKSLKEKELLQVESFRIGIWIVNRKLDRFAKGHRFILSRAKVS